MNPLTPYLIFDGDCREAMTLYQRCLGGKLEVMTYGEGGHAASPAVAAVADRIIHACLSNGPLVLMASDSAPEIPYERGNQMHVMLACESVEALERTYATLADAGHATLPPHDSFWGARFGMLTDRFGTRWMLSHQYAPQGAAA
ncbi:MAG TPA: VOC family protein [Gemmatirosa sp.]|nr:VOC family protein [Gemmatirosa sp.]